VQQAVGLKINDFQSELLIGMSEKLSDNRESLEFKRKKNPLDLENLMGVFFLKYQVGENFDR
jgi:hypothetical protein